MNKKKNLGANISISYTKNLIYDAKILSDLQAACENDSIICMMGRIPYFVCATAETLTGFRI